MDWNVMKDAVEPTALWVLVRVPSYQAVLEWCEQSIPEQHHPILTMRETNVDDFVINARFFNKHYASLFRLFWDEGGDK
jgi:hypothetical protein